MVNHSNSWSLSEKDAAAAAAEKKKSSPSPHSSTAEWTEYTVLVLSFFGSLSGVCLYKFISYLLNYA